MPLNLTHLWLICWPASSCGSDNAWLLWSTVLACDSRSLDCFHTCNFAPGLAWEYGNMVWPVFWSYWCGIYVILTCGYTPGLAWDCSRTNFLFVLTQDMKAFFCPVGFSTVEFCFHTELFRTAFVICHFLFGVLNNNDRLSLRD